MEKEILIENQEQQGANQQLQDLVDNTSEIIMLVSLNGNFIFVNKAFQEILGYSNEDLVSITVENILHPQFADETLTNLERIREGMQVIDFQTVVRNKDGKRVYLSGDVSCRMEDGKPVAFRCLFRDITQRRRAEKSQRLYYTIAQLNLNTRNLHEFLSKVHDELKLNIQANNFFAAVYEQQEGEIYFPYHFDEHYVIGETYLRRKLGNGIVEYSMVQNKPLFLIKEEIQQLLDENKIVLYGTVVPEIFLAAPLRIGEKTIGVICVRSYSDRNKFGIKDLELLEFISGQVAQVMVRKQQEESLLLQTSRLNAIFDSSSHFIWTVNQKRQLTSFNKNYTDLIKENLNTNPQVNASVEKFGWRLIAPEDRQLLREKYNDAFAGKPQYFEMHWGKIDGGKDWYEFYLNPILSSESGQIEEVSGIAQNITEKKNSTIVLQKSERKFRDIIDSFIDIYYRTDLGGNVTMISPSVLTHTGYTVEEVLGNKVDTFFNNAEDSSKNIKSLLKNGSITNFEVTVKRKGGELRPFMLNIRMVKDSKGFPVEVEGVARDISDLKKTAEELLVAKEEAEHSLKVKERFLANMSHEIRTPMNGVIGMVDLLIETKLNREQSDYLQTIRKSSETLLTILNDILDLSKIEAGKMDLHNAPLDVKELLESLVSLFRQKAIEKHNHLQFKIAEDVPAYLIADQTRLLQIFSNLTSNALKFTENGTVTISLSRVSANGKINILRGEVTDTGIGISEDGIKKLFGAFQQLDNSTKKSFGGTGLGLAISREFCRLMKGEMGVTSEEGKGSTFWFTIEVRSTTISPTISEAKEEPIILTNFFKKYSPKILLVDDNQVNRKVASEILQKSGCQVITADSGKKAIEVFSQSLDPSPNGHSPNGDSPNGDSPNGNSPNGHSPNGHSPNGHSPNGHSPNGHSPNGHSPLKSFDMIFMDIQMPEMDGIETTQKLRELYGNRLPKVVAMTAYSMQHDREKFMSQGMDDYVPKPIRAAILVSKVKEILELRITNDELRMIKGNVENEENENLNQNPKSEIRNQISKFSAFDAEVISGLKEMVGSEMLLTVFEDFEKEATEQILNVKNAFPDDIKTIQSELHTLKGNSGTIGLMRLHEITKEIEVPSKTGDLGNFLENLTILEQEFAFFKNHFRNNI